MKKIIAYCLFFMLLAVIPAHSIPPTYGVLVNGVQVTDIGTTPLSITGPLTIRSTLGLAELRLGNLTSDFNIFTTGATYSGTYNPVMKFGYNISSANGALNAAEPRFTQSMEGDFYDVGTTGHHLMEWVTSYTSADGLHSGRPFSFYVDKDIWKSKFFFSGDHVEFLDDAGTSNYFTIYMTGFTSAQANTLNTDSAFANLGSGAAVNIANYNNTNSNFAATDYLNSNGSVVARAGAINVSHANTKGGYAILTRNGGAFGTRLYIDEDGVVNTYKALNTPKGTDITAAATTDIGAATGNYVEITGNTGITAFGTVAAGAIRYVRFMGTPTLTYNATSLILPGAVDRTAEIGDRATFISLGSGNWLCHEYLKANGMVMGDLVIVTHSATEAATAVSLHSQRHLVTGAYTITLPAVAVGMSATFRATTAAVMCIDSNAADQFINGSETYTAGYRVCTDGTSGSTISLEILQANKISVYCTGVCVNGGA